MRVTQDHWSILVDYAENNQEIITNEQVGSRGRENLDAKWENLATLLNSVGNGEKTVTEWKKSLADWKSNAKKKYAMIRKSQTGTGGGPASSLALTDLEMQVLQLMGRTAIDGDQGVKEYGLPNKLKMTDRAMSAAATSGGKAAPETQKSETDQQKKRNYECMEDSFVEDENTCYSVDQAHKTNSGRSSRKMKLELSSRIECMNDASLGVLKSIDKSVNSIATDIKKMVSFFINRDEEATN